MVMTNPWPGRRADCGLSAKLTLDIQGIGRCAAGAALSDQQLGQIFDAFEQYEQRVIGPGRHEDLHAMLKTLKQRFEADLTSRERISGPTTIFRPAPVSAIPVSIRADADFPWDDVRRALVG